MKKVYFAGSIRGGRVDASLYQEIIALIQQNHIVLTEHVGKKEIFEFEKDQSDEEIYLQDINWLKQADLVIAECTCPSLGVGYEMAYAEKLNIPVYIFYRPSMTSLSAMLSGDSYFKIYPYEDKKELFALIEKVLR